MEAHSRCPVHAMQRCAQRGVLLLLQAGEVPLRETEGVSLPDPAPQGEDVNVARAAEGEGEVDSLVV